MSQPPKSAELGSVSRWLGGARRGDQEAIRRLWGRYFPLLVRLARSRLGTANDAEDVALDAFTALWKQADELRAVRDRTHLWRWLACVTVRRALDVARRESRRQSVEAERLESLASREPPAEFSAAVADLLECLPNDELRTLATAKMEGCTHEEAARRLGRSLSTIERKLQVIRLLWREVW